MSDIDTAVNKCRRLIERELDLLETKKGGLPRADAAKLVQYMEVLVKARKELKDSLLDVKQISTEELEAQLYAEAARDAVTEAAEGSADGGAGEAETPAGSADDAV